jgi:hypothetical protein
VLPVLSLDSNGKLGLVVRVNTCLGGPLHLDRAYATTVHSSQGLTAERVLVDASTRSRTTTKDVFYVAISRAQADILRPKP